MRKIVLAVVVVNFFAAFSASAQLSIAPRDKCYSAEWHRKAQLAGAESDAKFEAWILGKMQLNRRPNVAYNLPVIFHVIHNGETEGSGYNISQQFIHAQLNQLNKDYANASGSQYAVAASTEIRFSLAQKDPLGVVLPTAGIERINRSTKGWSAPPAGGWSISFIESNIKPSTIWDPTKYINIWILPIGDGVVGYATFPTSSTLPGGVGGETATNTGIAISYTSVGSVVTPASTNCDNPNILGRTLTHEMGHFLGLRHIWGDQTCGNDYVDDTPIHKERNYGAPTHPKANTCGTADEMFENYMDYADDKILSTFTAGQVARMQTVMVNSPRRKELALSNVGLVDVPSNITSFTSCNTSVEVYETATSIGFPGYRDIPVVLNVQDAATGVATISVTASGTAIQGSDYHLLTPTLNFVSGDRNKIITIRVVDDAVPEPTKTLTITYTITGSGIVAAPNNQSFVVTILDDDHVRPGELPIVLVNESFETAGAQIPTNWASLASATNRFVVSANGSAGSTGQAAHITDNLITKANTYNKTTQSLAGLRMPLIDATGLTNIQVSYKYRIAGEVSGSTAYDYGYLYHTPVATPNGLNQIEGAPLHASNSPITSSATVQIPASFQNSSFYLGFLWYNDNADGTDPGFNVDDVQVTANGTRIESMLNASNTFAVNPSTVNNFKSAQNAKLMATISNVSNNIPQLTVSIVEAGTDRPNITTHSGFYMRSRKVFQVSPPVADNITTYTITLYFTPAEVAEWGAAVDNLKILKVSNNTNVNGLLSTSDGVIVTPTVNNQLTTAGFISYTATFTGFSKFMLVQNDAVLPVRWLNFSGQLVGNSTHLQWKTATEQNNLGFEVERSTDGRNFAKVGFVAAQNQRDLNSYIFDDNTIIKGNKYYYRLKQVNIDGRFSYSEIVDVSYLGKQPFTWYPNPVRDILVVDGNTGAVNSMISISDLSGKLVYRSRMPAGKMEISTSTWAAGIYTVRIDATDEPVIFKVVKE